MQFSIKLRAALALFCQCFGQSNCGGGNRRTHYRLPDFERYDTVVSILHPDYSARRLFCLSAWVSCRVYVSLILQLPLFRAVFIYAPHVS